MTESCVHCGLCTKNCSFLQKYGLDLASFSKREDLAYHCFLCGTCRRVCPKGIDGRAVAMALRHSQVEKHSGKVPEKGYAALLAEKENYLFRNYRRSAKGTALFPGCNFPSFFPATTDLLVRLLGNAGIGTIFDCCGKPIGDLGLQDKETRATERLTERLKEAGIERLVVLCPNCYAYLTANTDIEVISIYTLLRELGIGEILHEELNIFLPCPDRDSRVLLEQLKFFVPHAVPIYNVQCCGLGGCAGGKEPEIAAAFARKIGGEHTKVYTYCASCAGQLRRGGAEETTHILTEILGTHEKPVLSPVQSLWNRAKRIF